MMISTRTHKERLDNEYQAAGGMKGEYRRLFREGKTIREIAGIFGMSRFTLMNYWRPKWKREDEEEARANANV